MKNTYHFLIAGGDRRQQCLARLLEQDGHRVETLALDDRDGVPDTWGNPVDCLVLPVPPEGEDGMLYAPLSQSRIDLPRLLKQLPPGQLVCSGGVTEHLRQGAEERGLSLINYLTRLELAEANAIPTAEGAIRIAMEELPCTIHGCKTLVIGAGRCGMALARRLKGLNADLTVTARNWKDFARIRGEGIAVGDTGCLMPCLKGVRLLFNTVPALVLDNETLSELPADCLVIDLASRPGGVDLAASRERGIKVISALGLPGKESPQTAAENLRDGLYHAIKERVK